MALSYVLSSQQVGKALSNLGRFRVAMACYAAGEGPPDNIGGHHILALGLRETHLKNINNPADTDHGWSQISENYHLEWLRSQPGCKEGTWKAVPGHTADETGYCPRFTPALNYSLRMIKSHRAYAIQKGVPSKDALRVAFNGYNRGIVGAINAYKAGMWDAGTTGNDYGAWCLHHAKLIKSWLDDHPQWRELP